MSTIFFFEKPGCGTNARQKRLLEAAGYVVLARNLLTEPWTEDTLLSYFGGTAVADWFNPAAPAVKSGLVDPASIDQKAALARMLADPILIRRPLIEVAGQRRVGFNPEWFNLDQPAPGDRDIQVCSRPHGLPACPAPAEKIETAPS
jgi:nitrogenase-associated protein